MASKSYLAIYPHNSACNSRPLSPPGFSACPTPGKVGHGNIIWLRELRVIMGLCRHVVSKEQVFGTVVDGHKSTWIRGEVSVCHAVHGPLAHPVAARGHVAPSLL